MPTGKYTINIANCIHNKLAPIIRYEEIHAR